MWECPSNKLGRSCAKLSDLLRNISGEENHSSKGAFKYYISTFMGGGHGLTSAKNLLIILKKIRTFTLVCKFIPVLSGRVEANLHLKI